MNPKIKIETHTPKTIIEAIKDLYTFLDADLYTKFYPKVKIKGENWYRQDPFLDESDFRKYLDTHFKILLNQIKHLRRVR